MILLRLTLLAVALLMLGCESQTQTPKAQRQNYPAIIRDSVERRARAEREWRRMLDTYGVQQTPPDLHPIIYTPRSLLGVTGGINVMPVRTDPRSESMALREAMKVFLERWRELIGADPAAISLVSESQVEATRRLIYRQASYAFPVAGNYGEMTAIVSPEGRLLQLDSRFIPVVELPVQPSIQREEAAKRVVGRTFTYADLAGREQRVQINAIDEVSVKQLVILPIEKGDAIEVRLAWEIVAGSSLSWTVYIDAVGGEQLQAVQNFQT
jgi:hypothetical protein